MNIQLITKWFENSSLRQPMPSGCYVDFLKSPINPEKYCVHVGVIQEHRFAFYYWAQFKANIIDDGEYDYSQKPILVTLDYHNDVGADNDCRPDDLINLNINDKNELGIFCWFYLNPLNDGHILPALYLDFFSDVCVLTSAGHFGADREYNDYNSNIHKIKYFREVERLIDNLEETEFPIFLDIDLDFFTRYSTQEQEFGSARMIEENSIRNILSLQSPLMTSVYGRLIGLTIALEPKHCGGLNEAFKIFNILNDEFFNNTLFTDKSMWKESNS